MKRQQQNNTGTKQRILDESLKLFATKGYTDVYVGEIADAVGIKAPSLYKHYKSKKDIFEALIYEMKERYSSAMGTIGINGQDSSADASIYENITEEAMIEAGKNLFLFFLHDEYMSCFRRILTMEQYNNKDLGKMYTKQFFEDPIKYQGAIFGMLIRKGKLVKADPQLMALEFYAPIYTLLTQCDRDPKLEPEALELIDAHIRAFNKQYGRKIK